MPADPHPIPASTWQIAADPELTLFAVVVLKKCVDEFRHSAREKRYTIRDFTYTASKKAEDATQVTGTAPRAPAQ